MMFLFQFVINPKVSLPRLFFIITSIRFTNIPSDPLELALVPAYVCSFVGPPHLESEFLSAVIIFGMICPVSTVVHIPCSVYPLLTNVSSAAF